MEGKPLVMNTCAMGAVPVFEPGRAMTNLVGQQDTIQNARDTLFGAY